MNRKEELQQAITEAQSEIYDIEAEGRDGSNASKIGNCYQFRHQYGGHDKWWVYQKILRCEKGNLVAHRFQTDGHGEISIQPEHRIYEGRTRAAEQITAAVFDEAWAALKSAIDGIG